MPTTSTRRNHRQTKPQAAASEVREILAEENVKEMTRDVTEYITDYARQNPGAALTCLGIGFVLGWKLKPW